MNGIEIRGVRQKRGEIDPHTLISEDMPIELLVLVKPGQMEYFVSEIYDGMPLELRMTLFERIRKWPSDWSSILIEPWSDIIAD